MTPKSPAKPAASKDRTAALAARLKSRADARAARSVDEDLLAAPETAAVAALSSTAGGGDRTPEPRAALTLAPPSDEQQPDDNQPDNDGSAVRRSRHEAGGGRETAHAAPADSAKPVDAEPAGAGEGHGEPPIRGPRREGGSAKKFELTRPIAGPDGRLELSGERVVKMTLELPTPLVDALARWERDETVRTGQRVYRERLINCALSALPDDVDALVALARGLGEGMRSADTEQVGTRVRETIQRRLKNLRPELRVRRVRDVYLRHIYAAAIAEYLARLGVDLDERATLEETPRNRETETND